MSFMLGFIIPSRQNGIKNKIVKINWILAEFEYSNSALFANLIYSVKKIRNTKTDKEEKKNPAAKRFRVFVFLVPRHLICIYRPRPWNCSYQSYRSICVLHVLWFTVRVCIVSVYLYKLSVYLSRSYIKRFVWYDLYDSTSLTV